MKIKTVELTGAALDWAVAKCEGMNLRHFSQQYGCYRDHQCEDDIPSAPGYAWKPSTDWSQSGPIIERESINVTSPFFKGTVHKDKRGNLVWSASIHLNGSQIYDSGPTPLIAVMRCYVASKLGDEVDIPEELMQMRTFKILDASGVAYNRIKDGMVLEFIRDLPELGQVRLKQPPPLKGTVGMDYAHVEEVKP